MADLRTGASMPPAPGHARVWSDGGLTLNCLLGEDSPVVTSGYAAYDSVDRPGRRPLTVYQGRSELTIDLAVLLEDRVVSGSTRTKMRTLEKLAGEPSDDTPPTVHFWANMPYHDFGSNPARAWVISQITWTRSLFDDAAGLRQQEATVTFTHREVSSVARLVTSAPFAQKTMKKGESLRTFAKRVLGDSKRWSAIQDLNRDNAKCPQSPDRKVTKAITLKVPPKTGTG